MGDLPGSFPGKAVNNPYKLPGRYKWYQSLASPSTVWFEDEPCGAGGSWQASSGRPEVILGWVTFREVFPESVRVMTKHTGKPRGDVWGHSTVPEDVFSVFPVRSEGEVEGFLDGSTRCRSLVKVDSQFLLQFPNRKHVLSLKLRCRFVPKHCRNEAQRVLRQLITVVGRHGGTSMGSIRALETGRRLRESLGFPIWRVLISPAVVLVQSLAAVEEGGSSNGDGVSVDPSEVKYGLCEMVNNKAICPNVAPKDGNLRFDIVESESMLPDFKYDGDFKLWWKKSKQRLLNNLKILSDDRESLYLANYAKANDEEVEIYVEQVPSEAQQGHVEAIKEEVNMVEEEDDMVEEEANVAKEEANVAKEEGNVAKEEEEGSGEDKVDDSEEERMTNDVGEFGMENERVVHDDRNINPILYMWSRMKNTKKTMRRRNNVDEGLFIINEEVGDHDINEM
ncbi:hypothetical protein V8G54_027742 [Vigna mungo]|uniref:PB1-like domain-containing protein n=1 Tax=Vigna mungo TaxID=3915 RepID=A0AAQ3RIQ6_VIGMU